ncbi:MAG: HTH-type transcriptional repressor AseR [Pelotomaculum sp. PtaB.Bin104]|nr:MAG: HTH-type transcriptional repressor AseR [Pelotomaculum sp. PtaB.Bin104]
MINIVDILKALSDETRLRIINLLFEGELCVCDIMETLDITQAKASRHLGVLRRAGLVKDRKSAQWVYYTLAPVEDNKYLDSIVSDHLRQTEPYTVDLKNLVGLLPVTKPGSNKYSTGTSCCSQAGIQLRQPSVFFKSAECAGGVPSFNVEDIKNNSK